ncbi:hypothetical protein EVAR_20094_1 [Eumeta japonica]|uniref:Uncharacterized protein n=1 Tax=Eumeta variegata TaxID=151549 RepID=A0A4C1V3Q5_EUMVA|nr:hypothetical protein EVAR_20094_1 [Eumeta japonica]
MTLIFEWITWLATKPRASPMSSTVRNPGGKVAARESTTHKFPTPPSDSSNVITGLYPEVVGIKLVLWGPRSSGPERPERRPVGKDETTVSFYAFDKGRARRARPGARASRTTRDFFTHTTAT